MLFLLLRILTISISKDIVSYKDQRKDTKYKYNNNSNNNTKRQLFVDDTSILVIDSHKLDFNIGINNTFLGINTWFKDSLLFLNFNKTQYLEFRTKHYYNVTHNRLYSPVWALASSL